jgi:hypothetical protein
MPHRGHHRVADSVDAPVEHADLGQRTGNSTSYFCGIAIFVLVMFFRLCKI